MKIAIHGRNFKEETRPYIQQMFDELVAQHVDIQLSELLEAFLRKTDITLPPHRTFADRREIFEADFMFSLGGDGTLLETITHVGPREIPILGINTGRLGFLATTSPQYITEAIRSIFSGYYTVDNRTLICLESDRNLFDDLNFGLNEFAIIKRDTSSMIGIKTFIDGEYLNTYWADGIIIATPTGSTGYSLSCGGPVVLPQSNNFIIAPVSPHNLNVRPLIVSDKSIISFEIQGRNKNYLISLDSRSRVVDASIQIAVRKESFCARLIRLKGDNFLHTLRNKLNWGLDARN